MDHRQARHLSRFLSLILRHHPETIGVELDSEGWIEIDVLLEAMGAAGKTAGREELEHVVATNDKQRFAISDDGRRIRAHQGHSVDVELGHEPAEPPAVLYHGTPSEAVEAIRREGLVRMMRHHVHLHADVRTATSVGARKGQPVLLAIRAAEMHRDGYEFLVTPNEVWLTDRVPPSYIDVPDET